MFMTPLELRRWRVRHLKEESKRCGPGKVYPQEFEELFLQWAAETQQSAAVIECLIDRLNKITEGITND
jgi:hypothetical protein